MHLNRGVQHWEIDFNLKSQTMGDVSKLWSPTLGDGSKPQKSNHGRWIYTAKVEPWVIGLNNEIQTTAGVSKLWGPTLGDGSKPQRSNHGRYV